MFQFPLMALGMLLFFVLLGFLFIFVQIGLLQIAFAKIGLTGGQAFLILVATLFGSGMNIPVYRTGRLVRVCRPQLSAMFRHVNGPWNNCQEGDLRDQTVAVNVGGCIIPLLLCLHLIGQIGITLSLILATALVTGLCYRLARPIEGVGIGIPVLIPPLAAAIFASLFSDPGTAPHVAYICGTLGTLLGADILNLLNSRTMAALDAPLMSIGGAGTFDGIFITGVIAVLLA